MCSLKKVNCQLFNSILLSFIGMTVEYHNVAKAINSEQVILLLTLMLFQNMISQKEMFFRISGSSHKACNIAVAHMP